ncbi:hypothetical protein BDV93DRAFT_528507 [Ceratobasidium sp. AG-I]|nr:hypothetical protein BDV93DRAFT_528507 [Ceratobasidium sp. AG-I]
MTEPFTEKIDDLVSSIDELEEVLGPLLETSLSKLTSQLSAPLDRAKLQVWLSYVLNDLVWILLKTRGVNPSNLDSGETHDVVAELDRVKGYFAKIKEAENPAKRSLTVDGKVANRFIKHALASAISPANFASSSGSKSTHIRFDETGAADQPSVPGQSSKPDPTSASSSSDSDAEPEVGTWKAKKRAREEDLANQRAEEENGSEKEEVMEGWEEPNAEHADPAEKAEPQVDGLGGSKRARMDPFAGYSGSTPKPPKRSVVVVQDSSATSASTDATPQPIEVNDSQPESLPPPSSATPSSPVAPKKRKARRGTSHPRRKKDKVSKEGPSTS